ncbi:MAG: hypothetical protein JJV94_02920 [Sulfurospirillum sp.]|nr:hypothetical protein [Sulfurospirillum sp.]
MNMTTTTITHVTIDEALADYLDKQFKDLKDDKDDKDKEDEDRLFMLGEPSLTIFQYVRFLY